MRNVKEMVGYFMPQSALGSSVGDASSERLGGDDGMNLTRRVSESVAKPISELTTADVATMLRQEVGGDLALALALMIISEEPLICGDSYSGDILKLALERDWQAWWPLVVSCGTEGQNLVVVEPGGQVGKSRQRLVHLSMGPEVEVRRLRAEA